MPSSSFTLGRTQNSDVQMISVIRALTWLNMAFSYLAISKLLAAPSKLMLILSLGL